MLGLAIQNKNSARNALLNFLLDLFKLKGRVHIRTKINSQKKFLCENCKYYFDLAKIKVGQAHIIKN